MKQEASIKSFTDLHTWQEGHKLVLAVYKMLQDFPREEQFGLASQMRRSAVSVTSNIAEGFSRSTWTDKKHFYVMAHGSLTELQNQLLVARDVSYVAKSDFDKIAAQAVTVHKLLTGLIKSTNERHDS